MSFGQSSTFEDSTAIFEDNGPTSLVQRLGYVKQLIMSRTKLEFRLLWNKIFQKEDEELGWLLSPYRQQTNGHTEATMLASLNRNLNDSYQYEYHNVKSTLGREKVTIYNRSLVRKSDTKRKRKEDEKKSFKESALDIARYMGMGVYMTSSSFPSPFLPINDLNIYYDESHSGPHNVYSVAKVW